MVDTLARVDVKRALPDGPRKLVMTGAFLLEKLVPSLRPCPIAEAVVQREVEGAAHRGVPEHTAAVSAGGVVEKQEADVREG